MTVKKRGKTWQVRINYSSNGKYKQKSKSGFKTKAEALAFEANYLSDINTNQYVLNDDKLFTGYYDTWLDTHLKTDLAARTIKNHEGTQKIVHEYFDGITLKDLNRLLMQDFVNDFGKTRKPATVRQHFNRIKMPIQTAFADGLIRSDPTFNVRLPKASKQDKTVKYLEKAQMYVLLNEIEANPLTPRRFAIYISLLSGLRLGEVLALTLDDVDTNPKELTVNKSKSELPPFGYGKTKTESSNRTITMPDRFFEQLKRYQKENPQIDKHFLGEKLNQGMVNYELEKTLQSLDIPRVSFHALRHTHASFLINEGIDIAYVSSRLGHANVSMTEDVYFHLMQEKKNHENEKAMALF